MQKYHGHCNKHGISKENRKHARLMQKANKLGAQDLLEIAAMKGITMIASMQLSGEPPLAPEPAVGIGSKPSGSTCSTETSGSEAPTASVVMIDNGISPPLEEAEMDEDDDGALRTVPENADEDARLGL